MRIAELDYELPEELIAQAPAARRDESRLLVIHAAAPPGSSPASSAAPALAAALHRRFRDLPELLQSGDLLVVNDARVLAARVYARRPAGGRVELLFLGPGPDGAWRALARPARRLRPGARLRVGEHDELEVLAEAGSPGERLVRAVAPASIAGLLQRHGRMPLPPYIHPPNDPGREALDRERYQTVYAASPGAVAAPTAGLHFTRELLDRLEVRGVEVVAITLEVGPGTFRPVTVERSEDHVMDGEPYRISTPVAEAIEGARCEGRRVIAVGTTSVRALEHAGASGPVRAGSGVADLFVTPAYRFRVIDGMVTNFHLPRSTPLLMVAALAGKQRLLAAYAEAVAHRYRFYSYGDAMLVLPAPAA